MFTLSIIRLGLIVSVFSLYITKISPYLIRDFFTPDDNFITNNTTSISFTTDISIFNNYIPNRAFKLKKSSPTSVNQCSSNPCLVKDSYSALLEKMESAITYLTFYSD